MFETTLIASRNIPSRKGKIATLPVAIAFHIMVLGGFRVAQLWAIEPVPEPIMTAILVVDTSPPPGDRGDRKPATSKALEKKPPKTQPPISAPEQIPTTLPPPAEPEHPAETGETVPGGVFDEGEGAGSGGGRVPGGIDGDDTSRAVEPQHQAELLPATAAGIVAPVPILRTAPVYPEVARRMKIQGTVMLRAVIDTTGTVTNVQVNKGLGFGLDEAAAGAVRQWRYDPATRNGRPVAVFLFVEITFSLH
jgi:protein TonB